MASVRPRRSATAYSGFDRQPIARHWKAGSAKGRLDEANAGAVKAQKAWAAAVDAFTTDKSVTVQHVPRQFPASAEALKGLWAGG